MNKKNVLVIGGCGRIGASFSELLLKKGHNVIIGDNNKIYARKLFKKN